MELIIIIGLVVAVGFVVNLRQENRGALASSVLNVTAEAVVTTGKVALSSATAVYSSGGRMARATQDSGSDTIQEISAWTTERYKDHEGSGFNKGIDNAQVISEWSGITSLEEWGKEQTKAGS